MDLSLGEAAAILGSVSGAPERVAKNYSIDTRTLATGALFFALHGPNFDGHSFVARALEHGAVGAVVERNWAATAPASLRPVLIPVPDTVSALQDLGRAVRHEWGRPLIAVTGSTGKTTTKELIAAALGTRYSVHKSVENLNNHLGVPLTLLDLSTRHDVAVLEMGMSHAGEIAHLARIAGPTVGVVTNVAPAHLEFFDSVDAIAAAKRELIENLVPPSTAVLNYDNERVRAFGDGFSGRVISYGFESGADFRASQFRLSVEENGLVTSVFRVRGPDLDMEFRLPLPGRHNVENALAAVAVGRLMDVSGEPMAEAIAAFTPLRRRAEVLRLAAGITLINDCYNSNPRAFDQMLDLLRDWPGAARRVVIAGEMLELGFSSPELHRAAGRKCASSAVDWLLAVQGDAQMMVEGAVEAGLPRDRTRFFSEAGEAGRFGRSIMQRGDVILVKGSRGVHLERAVEELAQD
ncbi:MAG TPA: UDP-N-acetylmuramoyl-tripeptide--D-alanyl-D-alanine ligase [Terriglobia bacterium]|nr:UDP-N-acetylmuramoyl-tripeptide--D-alanyl-D-alanine ligase [Terriglobia bacterium]